MAYVIAQPCIGVKDTACVDACPTDAIHGYEESEQLYIDPATCIDCDACAPACPVSAIFPGDQVPDDQKKFIQINADFFKSFDKSKSIVYATKKEGEAPKEATDSVSAPSGEDTVTDAAWKEVENWEALWEEHKQDMDEPVDRLKRYGRVRSVYEQADQYIIRIFLPEKTPNHKFVYQYGLPTEMSSYSVEAELKGSIVSIYGKIQDPRLVKLCGHVNSFPDRFYLEYPCSKPVASVSVKPQGKHVVDVVVTKAKTQDKAA